MAWTYTQDPENVPIDMVRFLCGDTKEIASSLSDSEINYLIQLKGSPQSAAIAAGVQILAKLAREADYTIGPESVKASQRFENYKKFLDTLKGSLVGNLAVPSWYDPMVTRPAIFDIGMHDAGGVDDGLASEE